jgi:excisionase family DNA binding protein
VSAEPAELPAAFTVPALLTVAQIGQVLGCSTRTVRRRIAAGELEAVVVADHLMVRGDSLRAYVDGLERFEPGAGVRRHRTPRRRTYDFLTD